MPPRTTSPYRPTSGVMSRREECHYCEAGHCDLVFDVSNDPSAFCCLAR
jgi:hypothetical protein